MMAGPQLFPDVDSVIDPLLGTRSGYYQSSRRRTLQSDALRYRPEALPYALQEACA